MSGLVRWIASWARHTRPSPGPSSPAAANLFPDSDLLNDFVGTLGTSSITHATDNLAGLSGNVVTLNEGSGNEIILVFNRRNIAAVPGARYNFSFGMGGPQADFLKFEVHADVDGVSYYLHPDGSWTQTVYEMVWPYDPAGGDVRFSIITDPIPPGNLAYLVVEDGYRNAHPFTGAKVGFFQVTQGVELWPYQTTSTGTPPAPSPQPPAAGTQTQAYQEDTSTIRFNPGQGLTSTSASIRPTPAAPWSNVASNMTVEWKQLEMLAYKGQDLPQSFLDSFTAYLAGLDTTDVKALIRPRYSHTSAWDDASVAQAARHLQQLGPILTTYKRNVVALQMGFAGAWGECHIGANQSEHDLVRTSDAGGWKLGQIIAAALANLDPDLYVELRNLLFFGPLDQSVSWPWGLYGSLPNPANKFDGSDQMRLGFYNDCIGDGATMGGSFYTGDGMTLQRRHDVLAAYGRFAPVAGEGCGGSAATSYNTFAPVSTYLAEAHQDILHASYPNWWANYSNADLATICRKLGARLVFTEATLPTSVTANASMNVSVTIKNSGWGKVHIKHPLVLVLDGAGGPFEVTLLADVRASMPEAGQSVTLNLTVTAPAGLQSGQSYAAHVKMPDPAPELAARVGSMVWFANLNMWNGANGWHDLGMSVSAV